MRLLIIICLVILAIALIILGILIYHVWFQSQQSTSSTIPTLHLILPLVSQKWGQPVTFSGSALYFDPQYRIVIDWGDDTQKTILPVSSTFSVDHTFSAGGVHSIIATLVDLNNRELYRDTYSYTPNPHNTQLILDPINDTVGNTTLAATGSLYDLDDHVGIDNMPITFSVNGSQTLSNSTTEGIIFSDPLNMTVTQCIGSVCTPSYGSNLINLHKGSSITFPPGNVGVSMILQDTIQTDFTYTVIPFDGQNYQKTSKGQSPFVTLETTYVKGGIKAITIDSIVSNNGADTIGLSEIKTLSLNTNSGALIDSTFDSIKRDSYQTLEIYDGSFNSADVPLLNGNNFEAQAHFAGNFAYIPADSNLVDYHVDQPTFGVGGSETTGVVLDIGGSATLPLCSTTEPDSDRDGLCDVWETNGIQYDVGTTHFQYTLPGAHVNQKDIYVEVDSENALPASAQTAYGPTGLPTIFSNIGIPPLLPCGNPPRCNPGINLHFDTSESPIGTVSPLHIWTDFDSSKTNDFDSIKAVHFGDVNERPSLSGGTNSITGGTITTSGVQLSTPASIPSQPSNPIMQGTITIKYQVTLSTSGTATISSVTPTGTWNVGTGINQVTFGPITSSITTGTSTTQTVTIQVPFVTAGAVSSASLGNIVTTLASTSTLSNPVWLNSPTATSTLQQAKALAFHYELYVNCIIDCNTGPSGISEGWAKGGNDMVIGLQRFGNTLQKDEGTFMHELGHNLGLRHGGPFYVYNDDGSKTSVTDGTYNCKPNYPSVMSYSRQFETYFSITDHWIPAYSQGSLPPLQENNAVEANGLVSSNSFAPFVLFNSATSGTSTREGQATASGTGAIGIEWDGSSPTTDTVTNRDFQNFGITDCSGNGVQTTAYRDWNDWAGLYFNFTQNIGYYDGLRANPEQFSNEITVPMYENMTLGSVELNGTDADVSGNGTGNVTIHTPGTYPVNTHGTQNQHVTIGIDVTNSTAAYIGPPSPGIQGNNTQHLVVPANLNGTVIVYHP